MSCSDLQPKALPENICATHALDSDAEVGQMVSQHCWLLVDMARVMALVLKELASLMLL